jgi:two-component system chemotaxis response regulator CheB
MGRDGLRGSEELFATGGCIVAQDEATSVVWGMAGAVVAAGIADGAWPINELGHIINRRIAIGRAGWPATLPARTAMGERV